jgi:acyl carrier protein
VNEIVIRELRPLLKDQSILVNESTNLIGSDGVIDSLGLVELCLRLEDAASDEGFEFDWTSEQAMSRNTSIFRTVGSLSEEFGRQKSDK